MGSARPRISFFISFLRGTPLGSMLQEESGTPHSCEHAPRTGCSTASAAVHCTSMQEGNIPHQTHCKVPHLQNGESRTFRAQ